jgi:hypothetical protein
MNAEHARMNAVLAETAPAIAARQRAAIAEAAE